MNLTIKSVPPALHTRLVESAARNGRSLNAEVTQLLTRALLPTPLSEEDLTRQVIRLRNSLGTGFDAEAIAEARKEGRE